MIKRIDGRAVDKHLIPELEILATPGRIVLFAYDMDERPKIQADVRTAMQATARLFFRNQAVSYALYWGPGWVKGIDDVVAQMGSGMLYEIVGNWVKIAG